jgi:hypothetical protein
MKYVKMLGLLAVAAAALMAFAGTASATTLTSPTGTTYTGSISAESEGATTLHNTSLGVSVSCNESKVTGKVETSGAGVTAGGKISTLTFTSCGEDKVTVLTNGSLEIHRTSGYNGTLTSSGAAITITDASTGVSCTYTTSNTDIGSVTGGSPATLSINSATIPRTGDSFFCGSSGQWTGSYKVTSPGSLYVDA